MFWRAISFAFVCFRVQHEGWGGLEPRKPMGLFIRKQEWLCFKIFTISHISCNTSIFFLKGARFLRNVCMFMYVYLYHIYRNINIHISCIFILHIFLYYISEQLIKGARSAENFQIYHRLLKFLRNS